jgi:hypothetical protein
LAQNVVLEVLEPEPAHARAGHALKI